MIRSITKLMLVAPLLGGGLLSANTPVVQSQVTRQASASDDAVGMLFEQIQRQNNEIMALNGQVEELRFLVEQLRDENRQRYIELDQRVAQMSSASTATADSSSDSRPSASVALPVVDNADAIVAGTPQQRYDRARSLLLQRQLPEAIFAFNAFLSDLPEHALSANAAYWLGETYALLPDFSAANDAFMLVLRHFPDDPKAPDALFKLGVIAEQLGDQSLAREYFSDVIDLFPNSQAARLAERKL